MNEEYYSVGHLRNPRPEDHAANMKATSAASRRVRGQSAFTVKRGRLAEKELS